MEKRLMTEEFNDKLKNLGFKLLPTLHNIYEFLREEKGYSINIFPEYYRDGINWNVNVTWLLPEVEWTNKNIQGGTFSYGDNGEYPTYDDALEFGIKIAIAQLTIADEKH